MKNEDKKSGKGRIFAKRAQIKKERANKTARKVGILMRSFFVWLRLVFARDLTFRFQYKKQLDKLESDLKELDAAETLSTKVKTVIFVRNFYSSDSLPSFWKESF